MELGPVLPILQKKPFDRTRQDVAVLSTWLGGNCAYFNGMPQDSLQALCQVAGHVSVEEGTHVFKQGQIGDCMYIVLKGYCSMLKHQQPDNSSRSDSKPAASRRGTAEQAPTNASQSASRRQTVEQQIQQFALATGVVADGSRRGTAEEHPVAGTIAGQQAGSRRTTTGAAGVIGSPSRRATAEMLQQQMMSEAEHVGWVSQGESIGEVALLNPSKPRQVSLVAGDGGAVLLTIDRAGWNRLQTQAQTQQGAAAAAVQAVLAAACRPLLALPPNKRTPADVDKLTELLSGLEAFQLLPEAVRAKLAKNCQAIQLPVGAVVFREDQKGDAMYVVMSGTCHVRARPLKPTQVAAEPSSTPELAASASAPATTATEATSQLVGTTAGASPALPTAGGARYSSVGSHSSVRRTTWEGAAFTPQEQAKLEAVKAAIDADRQLQKSSTVPKAATTEAQPGNKGVEKDALYWTAKYMHDAAASATGSDPQWGLEGGLTPLAAVFAAKWRQQMRRQQAEQQAQQQQDDQAAADDRAYKAMEELLGKAAAKAWKTARDSSSITTSSHQSPADAIAASADGRRLTGSSSSKERPDDETIQGRHLNALPSIIETSTSTVSSAAEQQQTQRQLAHSGSTAGSADGSSLSTPRSGNPAAASAAAAGLMAAAAQASDPGESLKLQLAALGVRDPADVSRRLMEEVAARADLDGLLADVAGILERKGLPGRLSKKSSMKITKELNKRMLGGGSWKSYAPGAAFCAQSQQQQQPSATYAASCQLPDSSNKHSVASQPDSRNQDSRAMRASGDDEHDELATEATGMSTDDWRSSIDASEAASLRNSINGDYGMYERDGEGSPSNVGRSMEGLGLAVRMDGTAVTDPGFEPQSPEVLEELYGPVIRVLGPGESFGELALLSRNATRTATVVVASGEDSVVSPEGGADAVGQQQTGTEATGDKQQQATAAGASSGAMLIRISRSTYDQSVRSLQVAALEDLLGFLSSLPPFKDLSRELLTSLAVFVRPVQLGPGQLLTIAGDRAEGLIIVQEGEVKLLDTPPGALAADAFSHSSTSGSGNSPKSSPTNSRRATAEDMMLRSRFASSGGGSTSSASGSGGRGLFRQQSNPTGISSGSTSTAGSASAAAAGTQSILPPAGLGLSALSLGRVQQSSAPLAVLGPGSMLGENVLGYDPEQDPLQAIAAAKSCKARQAAAAAAASLTHQATAVAVRPCKVLLLSAEALRRFGRRVRAPLTQMATDRREFLQQRRSAVQETKSSLAQMMADMKQQLNIGAAAAAERGSTGTAGNYNSSPKRQVQGSAAGLSPSRSFNRSSTGPVLAGSAAAGSSAVAHVGGSSSSISGSSSLVLTGSVTSSSSGLVPNAALMAARQTSSNNARMTSSQWQQQQWQQQAYGELMQQQPVTQQVTAVDVARLRQVIPGAQAPVVSELAAAARSFPIGALNATAAAGAGDALDSAAAGMHIPGSSASSGSAVTGPGTLTSSVPVSSNKLRSGPSAKGLRGLLVPQEQQHGSQPRPGSPGSPCWTLGAGGRVVGTGSATAVAAAGAAAYKGLDGTGDRTGRRGPLGRELSACDSATEA